VSPGILDSLRAYRKVLKIRNGPEGAAYGPLEVLDGQRVEFGMGLRDRRSEMLMEFDPVFSARYEAVSRLGVRVGLQYRPSWREESDREEILSALKNRREDELALGVTLSGPHRDRFRFLAETGEFFRLRVHGPVETPRFDAEDSPRRASAPKERDGCGAFIGRRASGIGSRKGTPVHGGIASL
jgi:DNA replication and repair protein RecF